MAESFFDKVHKQDTHSPDVLSCLANLSNDEVFTSPELVNKMLDVLPQELFCNPNVKFLDPATKTGVFLREIAKRLLVGLEPLFPNLQERIDHIFHEQLFGIAITELTSLLARRSLYCSKYPNGKYSISHFNNPEGNIIFRKIKHTWKTGKCIYCGASQTEYDREGALETHAYQFIHNPKELEKMHFDVIIGNPPYQLSDGGAAASAKPIYHLFIEQAIKLNPTYIDMIVPSRWFTGGKGLEQFRERMLKDDRIQEIHDFPDASECFPGVEIKAGVNFFLWNKNHHGDCEIYTHKNKEIVSHTTRPLIEKNCNVFIRNNSLVSIYKKVILKNEKSFMEIVSSRKPYGLCGDFFKDPSKYDLPNYSDKPFNNGISIYGLDAQLHRTIKYVPKNYPLPRKEFLPKFKMFMARNQGSGQFGETLSMPIFAKENEACTETYIVIGPFNSEKEMYNCWSYIKTKFFRSMLGVKKNDQGAAQGVYEYVPIQDFSKSWTDADLYKKYNLSKEEIKFIEENVQEMEDR